MSRLGRGFTREEVLKAIEGCGGIVSPVAQKLHCAWGTARSYIDKWESTKAAFADERQQFLDACESILVRNVNLSMKQQAQGTVVDSGDAKWVMSRLGKSRGYIERQELTGADGSPIVFKFAGNVDPEEL